MLLLENLMLRQDYTRELNSPGFNESTFSKSQELEKIHVHCIKLYTSINQLLQTSKTAEPFCKE